MAQPNLFDYATKELSQDAVICWLLAWAGQSKEEDVGDASKEELRRCGLRLLHGVLPGIALGPEVEVRVHHQVKHIDILAHVNGRHVILIEDKTNTREHNDQLRRYYKDVRDGRLEKHTGIPETAAEDIHAICIKTGNQSLEDRKRIDSQGYAVFDREDFLRVLEPYRGDNEILLDFRRHLTRWQCETESFREWTCGGEKLALGWEGLYAQIEKHYRGRRSEEWGGLTSRNGGFFGVWMEPAEMSKNSRFAMWIEKERISFRLYGAKGTPSLKGMNRENQYWSHAFIGRGGGRFARPRRGLQPTATKPMCVAEWRPWLEFDEDGRLNMDRSVENIDRARRILLTTIRHGRK